MRIIFMGTPEFAVASLAALLETKNEVVAVITAPDKPSGRGQKIHQSDVKKFATQNGLKVLQPKNLKDRGFVKEIKSLHADLQVVVAFRMLPEIIWDMPPLGTINLHASLLPQYRGAAPINWAVINGEKESGVTTFKLQHEIDTGNIIDQTNVSIGENETAGDLHDKLMNEGAKLLVQSLQKIALGKADFLPQKTLSENKTLKKAPKIFKEDGKINWNKNVQTIHNHIRGLSPYPGAWTKLNGKTFKIFKAEKEKVEHQKKNGEVATDHKTFIKIACPKGYINLQKVQPAGKRRMDISDFLRGFRDDFHFE